MSDKFRIYRYKIWLMVVIFVTCHLSLITSCSSIDCPVQTAVRTVYSVRDASQQADTLRDTLSVVTYRVNHTDTVLLSLASGVVQFSLPVGYANPEDTLYFVFRNAAFRAIDTVLVKKENIPHFESVDCSASFFHNITAIRSTHHAIDTIIINNPSVTYDASAEHFYLSIKSRD